MLKLHHWWTTTIQLVSIVPLQLSHSAGWAARRSRSAQRFGEMEVVGA